MHKLASTDIGNVSTCSRAQFLINHEDDDPLVIKATPTCSPGHLDVLAGGDKPTNRNVFHKISFQVKLSQNLKSFPSNFWVDVKRTVLAGMFSPIANVSVAKRALSKPSPKRISMVSFKMGRRPP